MRAPLSGGSDADEPTVMTEINTTPLIDVMLVLLIMLIVTIPIQLHAIDLAMPTRPPPVRDDKPEVIRIDIERDGTVRWQAIALAGTEALQQRMAEAATRPVQPELHLRPDREVRYASVAAVLAEAQRAGLTRIGVLSAESVAE